MITSETLSSFDGLPLNSLREARLDKTYQLGEDFILLFKVKDRFFLITTVCHYIEVKDYSVAIQYFNRLIIEIKGRN